MTYKLNPAIEKNLSPVVLIFPDGKRQKYANGSQVATDVFEQKYVVESLQAIENSVELKLMEQEISIMRWSGEEATSFF